MTNSRWFTTPIDVFAPWSYSPQFVRAPYDYVIEHVARRMVAVGGSVSRVSSELGTVRQQRDVVPIDQWAQLMRTGEKEFTTDANADFLGAPTMVAKTANPAWCLVLRSLDDTNLIQWQLRQGKYTPPVDDAFAIYIQRYPDTHDLETYPKRVADLMHGSQGPHAVRLEGFAGISPGKEMDWYLHGTGITSGTKVKQILHWPEDDPKYYYPGLEKMIRKKGPVASRFTDDDLASVVNLFGIDIFDPSFYPGEVTTLCTGIPHRDRDDSKFYDSYRDKYMPGWRDEVACHG